MRYGAMNFAATLVAVGLMCVGAQADPCAPTIQPSPAAGKYGYTWRTGSTRCEGVYISLVGGNDVEIVSFFSGSLAYKIANPTVLNVNLAIKSPSSSPIHLRSVQIDGTIYYQLDGEISAGSPFIWPLGDVVQPIGISAEDLGL